MQIFISPCPNDTFAFYGLLHDKVDNFGIEYQVEFEDIDSLNQIAKSGNADVCKISAAVFKKLQGYTLLSSGAAIGYGNAPLVVAKKRFDKPLEQCVVAIPGLDTTAYALFKRFFPRFKEVRVAVFSDIMALVESGQVDLGVIIHEGRFVYKEHDLELFADLGDLWESSMKLPIPLGCIVAKTNLGQDVISKVEKSIKLSVQYALQNPIEPMEFVQKHAQELSTEVQKKHIDYFVNNFTVDMTDVGRKVIKQI